MKKEANIAPWLSVTNASDALEFYQKAFDTVELYRLKDDDGNIVVAQLSVKGADFWIQEDPGSNPGAGESGFIRMILTVPDPDAVFEQAVNAGAIAISAVSEDHGWRTGRIVDPFGHHWEIGKQLN